MDNINTNQRDLIYCCPYCKVAIHSVDGSFFCEICNRYFAVREDIPIFNSDTPYYGELPKDEMHQILDEIDYDDWKAVIHKHFAQRDPFTYQIIMTETRADFQYLFSLNRDSLVLDVGSGWGTITVPVAKRGSKVVAVDSTWERLLFLKKRSLQEQVSNITLVCANLLESPFAQKQFDLIILNGVLEWVPTTVRDGDPEILQLQALKECFRILKPGGQLYLGIENSHAIQYFLGKPDDHTGISYISFLPRDKATRLMMKKRGQLYRTYTYTKAGYDKLLRAAGFNRLEYYYPLPTYKQLESLIPLTQPSLLAFYYDYLQTLPDQDEDEITDQIKELEIKAIADGDIEQKVSSYAIIVEKANG